MQLGHGSIAVEQAGLQFDFPIEVIEIGDGVTAVFGNDLVASAVKTDGIAERKVEIQRQRPARRVAGTGVFAILDLAVFAILDLAEALVKLYRGRIGSVAGSGLVVLVDQGGIENQFGRHEGCFQGAGLPKK